MSDSVNITIASVGTQGVSGTTNADDITSGQLAKARQHAQTAYYDAAGTWTQPQAIEGTLGSELVTNGNFTTDLTGWSGANWSWSAGVALHSAGSTADLTQSLVPTIGDTYKVTFTVTSGSAGYRARLYFGGFWSDIDDFDGTYTVYITATSADPLLFRPSNAAFNGSVDSVSVKKITTAANSKIETPVDFVKKITVWDKIDFPDGHAIAIGVDALKSNGTGEFNIPGSNIAIGYNAAKETTTGHATVVGYRAGETNTTGVVTAFGKWALLANTNGHATAFGNAAGIANTTSSSVFVGDEAGALNTTGNVCVVGYYAGRGNVTGSITAIGHNAGRYVGADGAMTAVGEGAGSVNTGQGLTAVGYQSGSSNTTGFATAVGHNSLASNTTSNSVGVGYQAAYSNTTGVVTAVGYESAFRTTTGNATAIGYSAARENTTGLPTAIGYQAAYSNTTGTPTAIGYNSLYSCTTGDMIAIGLSAGYGVTPSNAPITDINGILIGNFANRSVASATVLSNYVGIGEGVLIDKSNQVKIGNSSITETVLQGTVITTGVMSAAGFGVGASADASLPFRASSSSNGNYGILVANASAGSSATSVLFLESDAGQAAIRQHSLAHAVWPGSTLINSPSTASGLVLLTSGASKPIDFYTNNTLRASISDNGLTVAFSSSSADLTTSDLTSGQSRLHKNTTSGLLKLFANDGGSIKSVTLS